MSRFDREPWLVHLVYELLQGDRGALGLLADDRPFRDHRPGSSALLFRYEFTRVGQQTRARWRRTLVGEYAPPPSLESPDLLGYLAREGFTNRAGAAGPPGAPAPLPPT